LKTANVVTCISCAIFSTNHRCRYHKADIGREYDFEILYFSRLFLSALDGGRINVNDKLGRSKV